MHFLPETSDPLCVLLRLTGYAGFLSLGTVGNVAWVTIVRAAPDWSSPDTSDVLLPYLQVSSLTRSESVPGERHSTLLQWATPLPFKGAQMNPEIPGHDRAQCLILQEERTKKSWVKTSPPHRTHSALSCVIYCDLVLIKWIATESVWWHMSVDPTLERWKQKNPGLKVSSKSKASLDYGRSCLNK